MRTANKRIFAMLAFSFSFSLNAIADTEKRQPAEGEVIERIKLEVTGADQELQAKLNQVDEMNDKIASGDVSESDVDDWKKAGLIDEKRADELKKNLGTLKLVASGKEALDKANEFLDNRETEILGQPVVIGEINSRVGYILQDIGDTGKKASGLSLSVSEQNDDDKKFGGFHSAKGSVVFSDGISVDANATAGKHLYQSENSVFAVGVLGTGDIHVRLLGDGDEPAVRRDSYVAGSLAGYLQLAGNVGAGCEALGRVAPGVRLGTEDKHFIAPQITYTGQLGCSGFNASLSHTNLKSTDEDRHRKEQAGTLSWNFGETEVQTGEGVTRKAQKNMFVSLINSDREEVGRRIEAGIGIGF